MAQGEKVQFTVKQRQNNNDRLEKRGRRWFWEVLGWDVQLGSKATIQESSVAKAQRNLGYPGFRKKAQEASAGEGVKEAQSPCNLHNRGICTVLDWTVHTQ